MDIVSKTKQLVIGKSLNSINQGFRVLVITYGAKSPYILSLDANCHERASRTKTRGLRGGQLNAARSIAAGRKILDRAVKSVM